MRAAGSGRFGFGALLPKRASGVPFFLLTKTYIDVGYVIEARIRFAINHETPRVLGPGEMFYEPTGALHSTSENAQPDRPAKILAFMLGPAGRPVVEPK